MDNSLNETRVVTKGTCFEGIFVGLTKSMGKIYIIACYGPCSNYLVVSILAPFQGKVQFHSDTGRGGPVGKEPLEVRLLPIVNIEFRSDRC